MAANETCAQRKLEVGVIGAGIAGCCLAIGLLQNPLLDVHLYEAYPNIRIRGSGVAFHGNAINAMDCISPEIKKAYFKKSHYMAREEDIEMATQFILTSGEHAGTLVAELGRAKGRRTVHRAHFIEGLVEDAIPNDHLHFGKRIVGMIEDEQTGKVLASFDDGTTKTFDVLFGSEGVHSPTRRHILGVDHPATNPVNHDQWRQFHIAVPMEDAKGVLPPESIEKVRCFCTPVGFVNGIPVDLGRTFSIGCYQRDTKCPGQGAPFDATLWKGYGPEVDALMSLLERDPREDWELQDHDDAPTYYKGHVAMIGDAAHATLPHAGNGAAQAIEDAAVLTGIFSSVTSISQITAALKAFDATRRPRSQKVVEITRRFGRLYSQNPDEIDLDDMRSQMKVGGMYTNGVDMEAQVGSAVALFRKLL